MDINTYKLSRTFLFRQHTLRTLRDILKCYGDGVPVYKRTPEWFLNHYLLGFAHPPHSKWCRLNFLEYMESSEEDSDDHQAWVPVPRPDNAQTRRPCHLRTVHRNQVWSIFASHAEWVFSIIQTHKDLKDKVDASTWGIFLEKVPQLRLKALLNLDEDTDGEWGLKDEQKGGHQSCKAMVLNTPLSIPKHKPSTQLDVSKGNKQESPSTCV
jgi:hypothetical protein